MDGLTVLVEAKKEYMGQLCSIMIPHMIETYENLYRESYKIARGKEPIKQFQRFLKDVKEWSNSIISQHVDKLVGTCGWFNDLMAAVFVSYVKILSSVRLNAENKKINIKLPTNDVFVHRCYENVAQDLYKNPHIYHDEMSEYERDSALTKRFVACIEATVQKLIPVQEILKTYISRSHDDLEFGQDAEDTEDPEVSDDIEPVVPEPEATEAPEYGIPEGGVPENMPGGVPTDPLAPAAPAEPAVPGQPVTAPVDPAAPVKHISMNSVPDDVLFPDASD
jgi:hypothetical protein